MKKKPGPKPKRPSKLAKTRTITADDAEWAWVCKEAAKLDVSASALVRRLIQQAMSHPNNGGI